MQQAPAPAAARRYEPPFVDDDGDEPIPLHQLGQAWLRVEGVRAVAAGVALREREPAAA